MLALLLSYSSPWNRETGQKKTKGKTGGHREARQRKYLRFSRGRRVLGKLRQHAGENAVA